MGKKRARRKKRYVENQKDKFRKSPEWKEFRTHMAEVFKHRDYITGRKLAKGYNVHHLKVNQEPETYCDLSNESNFIPLNSYSHKLLHYVYTYYKKDKTILNRLQEILDKMCYLTESEEEMNSVDPIDQQDMEQCIEEAEEQPSSDQSELNETS